MEVCLFTFVGASRGHLCDSTAFLYSWNCCCLKWSVDGWWRKSTTDGAPINRQRISSLRRGIVMRLSVCLSASIPQEQHVETSPNFLCMLLPAVARSSSVGVAICYVLPVLWMTSFLPIIGHAGKVDASKALAQNYEFTTEQLRFDTTYATYSKWLTRGEHQTGAESRIYNCFSRSEIIIWTSWKDHLQQLLRLSIVMFFKYCAHCIQ